MTEVIGSKYNFQPIFNMRLAGHLMLHGFVLMDTRDNEKCPGKKVFYFKNTEQIQKEMNNYLSQKKQTID